MNSRNKKNTVLISLFFSIFTVCLFSCGCKTKEVPSVLQLACPKDTPAAIAWLEDRLYAQDVFFHRLSAYTFDFENRGLDRVEHVSLPGLKSDPFKKFHRVLNCPATQMLPVPRELGHCVFLWGRDGIWSHPEKIKLPLPEKVFPPPGTEAITEVNGQVVALTPSQTRLMSEFWGEWKDGPHPLGGADAYYVGLKYLKRSDSYFTLLACNGEGLRFKLDDNLTPEIVARYPAVATRPFDFDYDPVKDIFWISSPSEIKPILRIARESFFSGRFPPGAELDDPTKVAGAIESDTVWQGGDFFITGDIVVKRGTTLTIGPGARINIDPDTAIVVLGTLNIEGGNDERALFDCGDQSDYWRGIEVESGGEIYINNAIIRRARLGVCARDANFVKIEYSFVENITGDAVKIVGMKEKLVDVSISNSSFDNVGGAAVRVNGMAKGPKKTVEISGNKFSRTGWGVVYRSNSTDDVSSTSLEVTGNHFNSSRRACLDIKDDGRAETSVNISENIIENGSLLENCVKLDGTASASVSHNYIHACGGAVIGLTSTAALIEDNKFDQAFIGIFFESSKGETKIIDNETYQIDSTVACDGENKAAPFSLMLSGNYRGKMFTVPGRRGVPRLECGGWSVTNNGDALKSKVSSFVEISVFSGLSNLPVARAEVYVKNSDGKIVGKYITNVIGGSVAVLPPGTYMVSVENGMLESDAVLENGKLTTIKLIAP